MKKATLSIFILITCGSLLIWGFYIFEKYNFTPGDQVAAPERFPASLSTSLLDTKVPTLLVFTHPKCTCTEATLHELAGLKAKLRNQIAIKVFISYNPEDSFEGAEIEKQAKTIPNIEVATDLHRDIAKVFNALTSGQTVMYAPEGNLLFQGGITGSRGHEGDNPGTENIVRIATGPFIKSQFARTPTFGCHL